MTEEYPPIWARGLVKKFGELVAVQGVDLEAQAGTCLALLGPNGAGKTTTVEMLVGLSQPTSGELRIMGMPGTGSWRSIHQRIGVQLQETRLLEKLSVWETLEVFQALYKNPTSKEDMLGTIGLEEKRHARVKTLSGGQQQRLALGCALINKPQVLFLDEPSTGLDPQARRRVWEIVSEFKGRGGTVLLTTHYMEEAQQLADQVIVIDHGKVIARGTSAELIAELGADSVVEFRLENVTDLESLPEELMVALKAKRAPRITPDGAFAVEVMDTQASLRGLLSAVESTDHDLKDLSTHRPTLEDVFMALTGRNLRDG